MNKKYKNIIIYLIPSTFILIVFGIIYYLKGLFPFGNGSIAWADMYEQQRPLFYKLSDILRTDNSIFYDFSSGMGQNFLGISAYYLISPFSLLTVLIPRNFIPNFMNILLVLKVCLITVSSMFFFQRTFKNLSKWWMYFFSVCYGLCSYTFIMYQLIGYLDFLIIFPLLLLALRRLYDDGNPAYYITLFTIASACNFYVGFMLFLFIIFWSTLVYYPMAHMVWGIGGFLAKIGSVDFAGGNVVHISSGVSALVLCLVLGKRKDYGKANYRIHNIPFVVLGASLLLFGWFGFNAGSALKADGLAIHAFATTAISAASGMLSWMMMDILMAEKPTLVGCVTGLVVGLVAITPGAGFVPVWASLIIGFVGSPICYFMISKVKQKFDYDDALDAFGCHGIGGVWGGLATGLFTQTSINSVAKWNGLFFGDTHLFIVQVISILVTIVVAVVGTLICIGLVRLFTPLRVEKRDEQVGLDLSEHNETAYPSFNGLD